MFDYLLSNYYIILSYVVLLVFSKVVYIKKSQELSILKFLFLLNIIEFLLYINGVTLYNLYIINFCSLSIYSIKNKYQLIGINFVFLILSLMFDCYKMVLFYNMFLFIIDIFNYLKYYEKASVIRNILSLFLFISILMNKPFIGFLFYVIFYYFYLLCEYYTKDELTNTETRKPLFKDLKLREKDISAIISIDLNNLKQINDTFGHEEGDKAIKTLAHIIKKYENKNMRLYRIGGDEFMIVCFNMYKSNINVFLDSITNEINNTKYSCAIGCAFKENNISIKEMIRLSDELMYKNKQYYKSVR